MLDTHLWSDLACTNSQCISHSYDIFPVHVSIQPRGYSKWCHVPLIKDNVKCLSWSNQCIFIFLDFRSGFHSDLQTYCRNNLWVSRIFIKDPPHLTVYPLSQFLVIWPSCLKEIVKQRILQKIKIHAGNFLIEVLPWNL